MTMRRRLETSQCLVGDNVRGGGGGGERLAVVLLFMLEDSVALSFA